MTAALLHQMRQAAAEYATARYRRDATIRACHAAGIPMRSIAEEASLSFQRVHQILREGERQSPDEPLRP